MWLSFFKIFIKWKWEVFFVVWLENIFLFFSCLINKVRLVSIVVKKVYFCRFFFFLSIDCLVVFVIVVLLFRILIYFVLCLFSWNKWLFLGFNLWYYYLFFCYFDVNCFFNIVYIYLGFFVCLVWFLFLVFERYFFFVVLK